MVGDGIQNDHAAGRQGGDRTDLSDGGKWIATCWTPGRWNGRTTGSENPDDGETDRPYSLDAGTG